ncbi:MAG TPA: DUF302 domain-containing protein [Bryobacteraceae bacterium]|nr:DUF302 domain-containing protein [Bryobacteraceae bacterium]
MPLSEDDGMIRYADSEPTANRYVIPEPFERALRLLRESLAKEGLAVPMELDLSGRMRKELGIALAPCRVLCVDSPMATVQAMAIDSACAVFLPLHLVVSGRGPQTLVHLASAAALRSMDLPAGVKAPIRNLQTRLSLLLQRIGGRQSFCALPSSG